MTFMVPSPRRPIAEIARLGDNGTMADTNYLTDVAGAVEEPVAPAYCPPPNPDSAVCSRFKNGTPFSIQSGAGAPFK